MFFLVNTIERASDKLRLNKNILKRPSDGLRLIKNTLVGASDEVFFLKITPIGVSDEVFLREWIAVGAFSRSVVESMMDKRFSDDGHLCAAIPVGRSDSEVVYSAYKFSIR